jgi:hypothetical protein
VISLQVNDRVFAGRIVNQAGKQMNNAGRGKFLAGKSFFKKEGILKSAYFLEYMLNFYPLITRARLSPGFFS